MKTLKELADLGAAAAFAELKKDQILAMCLWIKPSDVGAWDKDESARQAFAAAVRDAVLADLLLHVRNPSLPTHISPSPPHTSSFPRSFFFKKPFASSLFPAIFPNLSGTNCLKTKNQTKTNPPT